MLLVECLVLARSQQISTARLGFPFEPLLNKGFGIPQKVGKEFRKFTTGSKLLA